MPGFGLAHKPSRSKLRHSTVADPSTSENHARAMTHPQPPMSPAPSPIDPASGSGFKLFSWKKRSVSSGATSGSNSPGGREPRPYYPSEPPRPILKSAVSDQGQAGNIRFAKAAGGVWNSPAPQVEERQQGRTSLNGDAHGVGGGGQLLFNRPPPQLQIQIHQANLQRHSQAYDGLGSPTRSVSVNRGSSSPRRSSRPASPSTTSFGSRVRTESAPASSIGASSWAMQAITSENGPIRRGSSPTSPVRSDPSVLCSPPPTMPMHVTTPPTTYYPPMQSRAPPPSPFRPTTQLERRRSSLRTLPGRLPLAKDMAPARMSSLITESPARIIHTATPGDRSSVITLPGVPMLNIIPATPQGDSDEFAGMRYPTKREAEELGEGIELDRKTEEDDGEMEEIQADALPRVSGAPAIELTLDFSPFSPNVDLPLEESDNEEDKPDHASEASDNEAHSPPFESYPSLPSLSSQRSIPPSEQSMSTSSSVSSIMSFPDVEEALGSMLASLSDGNLPTMDSSSSMINAAYPKQIPSVPMNPGLGLGLDLPAPVSITAPLSPRKSRPPPIDTTMARALPYRQASQVPQSAPPVINHRVAFYGTAKAHPRSPTSGTFHHSLDDIAYHSSEGKTPISAGPEKVFGSTPSSSSLSSSSRDSTSTIGLGLVGCRDSMSLNSECSDDDLHTASIINLTPMLGRAVGEVRGEEVIAEYESVGMAL